MFAAISSFGMLHTAVSVSAIFFGLWAFVQYGRIDVRSLAGKLYLAAMLIGSTTAFGIFRTGAFTPGHVLSLVTLLMLAIGVWAARSSRPWAKYAEALGFSTSYLLLWVFTVTETLTRVPVGMPVAAGPEDPKLLAVQTALLVAFLVGFGYQVLRLRHTKPAILHV